MSEIDAELEATLRVGPRTDARDAAGGQPPAFDVRAAEAAGLADVVFATADSPVGELLLAATQRGLLLVSYLSRGLDEELSRLSARVSPRVLRDGQRLDPVRRELEEYFAGRRREFDLPLDWQLIGTGFARRVLEATAHIPYGGVSSYAGVAGEAGSPRAVRAAGNALGANPLPIVVPCHRVLRSGGALGGYGGGLERKRTLLSLEGR